MDFRPLHILSLAGILLAGTSGVVLAQTGQTNPQPGHAPGLSTPAPSVDTGAAGSNRFPVQESSDPKVTGSTGDTGAAVNPPGHPPGTIPPNGKASIEAGASGRNNCYPGQSGKPVGSTNPSGMPSQC